MFIRNLLISKLVITTSDDMGVYEEALSSKNIASKVLLPLIEFEFGFMGLDSPELIQSKEHRKQLERIFAICKKHSWTTFDEIRSKGKNPYFRISKNGFVEIYKIAGPFEDERKNNWANLLLERTGKKGGYMGNKEKTEDKVLDLLEKENKWLSVSDMCLKLRLLPSIVRESVRVLQKSKTLQQKRLGKTIFWKIG